MSHRVTNIPDVGVNVFIAIRTKWHCASCVEVMIKIWAFNDQLSTNYSLKIV